MGDAAGSDDDTSTPRPGAPTGDRPAAGAPKPPGRRQRGPFVARCGPGKYAWCRCGRSAQYPYCDGTHRGSDVTPVKVVFDGERTIVWCACGNTGNQPYCDGSHSRCT